MKKIILVVVAVVVLLAIGMFAFGKDKQRDTETDTVLDTSVESLTGLGNAEIIVPDSDVTVTLSNGEAAYTLEGTPVSGHVTLVDDMFAQWSEGDRSDMAAVFAVQPGGSGTFYYLVLFDVDGDVFTKKSEVLLGDRIQVEHVGIGELVHDPEADYRVTVRTLVRAENEPLAAAPTVSETRTFYVTNQQLEEVEVGRDDS
jgi:hypothetical protein